MAFYEELERWIREFQATDSDAETVYQVVHWIIATPTAYRKQDVYWFMYAAHGLCKDLIPLMSSEDCASLAVLYNDEYPKRDRMPVQKDIYKRLCKGTGKQ